MNHRQAGQILLFCGLSLLWVLLVGVGSFSFETRQPTNLSSFSHSPLSQTPPQWLKTCGLKGTWEERLQDCLNTYDENAVILFEDPVSIDQNPIDWELVGVTQKKTHNQNRVTSFWIDRETRLIWAIPRFSAPFEQAGEICHETRFHTVPEGQFTLPTQKAWSKASARGLFSLLSQFIEDPKNASFWIGRSHGDYSETFSVAHGGYYRELGTVSSIQFSCVSSISPDLQDDYQPTARAALSIERDLLRF